MNDSAPTFAVYLNTNTGEFHAYPPPGPIVSLVGCLDVSYTQARAYIECYELLLNGGYLRSSSNRAHRSIASPFKI